jgi:hypothetical protein
MTGRGIPSPTSTLITAELLFRHQVLGLLRDRELITQDRIDLLRSWRNSGFGVHNRTTVYPATPKVSTSSLATGCGPQ